MSHTDLITSFINITGINNTDLALQYLKKYNYNLEIAISKFLELDTMESQEDQIVVEDRRVREPILPQDMILGHDQSNSIAISKNIIEPFRNLANETISLKKENWSSKNLPNTTTSLADLFKPPSDINCNNTLDIACNIAYNQKKYVLINIQDINEFNSQIINRDIWADTEIRNIIAKDYILWQQYKDSELGRLYIQFYPNQNYPIICIMCPLTKQVLTTWNEPYTRNDFIKFSNDFLKKNIPEIIKPKTVFKISDMMVADSDDEDDNGQNGDEDDDVVIFKLKEPELKKPNTTHINDISVDLLKPPQTVDRLSLSPLAVNESLIANRKPNVSVNNKLKRTNDERELDIEPEIPEPAPGPDVTRLRFLFSDNKHSIIRRFNKSSTTEELYLFAHKQLGIKSSIQLFISPPKQLVDKSRTSTIENSKLLNSTIHVEILI